MQLIFVSIVFLQVKDCCESWAWKERRAGKKYGKDAVKGKKLNQAVEPGSKPHPTRAHLQHHALFQISLSFLHVKERRDFFVKEEIRFFAGMKNPLKFPHSHHVTLLLSWQWFQLLFGWHLFKSLEFLILSNFFL